MMHTEKKSDFTAGLSSQESLQLMVDFQQKSLDAVSYSLMAIANAVDQATNRLKQSQGRLIFIGAGSSIRLAVQDGIELKPTYSWPSERLSYLIAGGTKAILHSAEHSEDDDIAGIQEMQDLKPTFDDVVIALTASGQTPYTVAGAKEATKHKSLVIGLFSNANCLLEEVADCPILLPSGSEFIAGSTRMGAGTAQKICLNLLSTQIMINLGRTYEGQMVYVQASNKKLVHRSQKMAADISGFSLEHVQPVWQQAKGQLPTTLLMLTGLDLSAAQQLLDQHFGHFPNAYKQALKYQ